MRRQPWSDRISAAAIAACFHVLAILFLGLVSPTLHIPPRQAELETDEPVITVELTRMPRPEPKPTQRQARIEAEAPAPTPQVLSRPPSPSAPESTAVIQPAPQPEAPPKPRPTPAPPVPTVEAKAQPLEPPKPVEAPKAPEKASEKDKEKEKERERERERLQTQLAAAAKAETPAPVSPPPARPTASAAAPFVPAPGFRLPPGYGRTVETEGGGGLRGVLRSTVGCAHENYAALTPAERERCAKAFVRDAARGVRVDPLPSDKRDSYDAEAAANARRRASKEGGTASPIVSCDGPGANLGGGCLPDEAHAHIKPK